MLKFLHLFITVTIFLVGLFLFCERETNPVNPNQLPNTSIANIPKSDDTLFALVTLHWDGEDYDGFISAYEYCYTSYHVWQGDSFVLDWQKTTETSVTIPFESSDLLNYQRFRVRAIDDKGEVDPEPAQIRFYTVQTIFPETVIEVPEDEQQFFIIDHVTDWWEGVPLRFTASDADGEVVEYAWRVDGAEWTWTTDTSLFLPPDNFQPLDGPHTISVISRDNTNLVDPIGDSITVILVQPSFDKDILIIDETDDSLFTGPLQAFYGRDDLVDSFYYRIFLPDGEWDFFANGMPPKTVLGQYKLVIWHADNPYSNELNVHKLPENIEDIKDYLHVGGDFIMSGWRILKSFAQADPFPKTFQAGSFIHDYLHILEADETILIPTDFVGCNPWPQVTDTMYVDSDKLSVWPYSGMLGQINIMPRRTGFTDVMYVYANLISSTYYLGRGQPVGIRYYGSVFDTIVLGFPLFFIREDYAMIMADRMLSSLGYR